MSQLKKKTIRVAICDDHRSFIDGLAMVIDSQDPAMKVVGKAVDYDSLRECLRENPDVVLLDVDLGTSSSLTFLEELTQKTPAKILMITGSRDRAIHEEAILKGARGVLLKNEAAKVILRAIEKVNEGEIWIEQKMMGILLDKLNPREAPSPAGASQGPTKADDLTRREMDIISSLVQFEASTNKEIAENLFISVSTLKNHLTTIYSKLDVKNRVQLIKYALTHNLADPPK